MASCAKKKAGAVRLKSRMPSDLEPVAIADRDLAKTQSKIELESDTLDISYGVILQGKMHNSKDNCERKCSSTK